MDDGSSETCLDWFNNMNFKNFVWFIKANNKVLLMIDKPSNFQDQNPTSHYAINRLWQTEDEDNENKRVLNKAFCCCYNLN